MKVYGIGIIPVDSEFGIEIKKKEISYVTDNFPNY